MKHYDKEIKPNRYVYHITSKVFRESILTKGLVAKTSKYLPYQNSIFAHNCKLITMEWYPLVFDKYTWPILETYDWSWEQPSDSELITKAINRYYDIWQIDTYVHSTKWYIDDIGQKELGASFVSTSDLYIVSNGNIPKEAITLCHLRKDKLYSIKHKSGLVEMRFPMITKV